MTTNPYLLTTERLGLRPYARSDALALAEVFADPYAARFYPQMKDPDRITKWIEWNLRNYEEYGFGLWAVELRESNRFIGDAGLTYQPVEGNLLLEIGYHIHGSVRRQGYACEAAGSCRDFAFRNLRKDFVCSIVHPENAASVTVAKRIHSSMRECLRKNNPSLLFFTTLEQWKIRSNPSS